MKKRLKIRNRVTILAIAIMASIWGCDTLNEDEISLNQPDNTIYTAPESQVVFDIKSFVTEARNFTFTLSGDPKFGKVTSSDSEIRYTPNKGTRNAKDVLKFLISHDGSSQEQSLSIVVSENLSSVPCGNAVAVSDHIFSVPGTIEFNVLDNDILCDPDLSHIEVSIEVAPLFGTVELLSTKGKVRFTPNFQSIEGPSAISPNQDRFYYRITDVDTGISSIALVWLDKDATCDGDPLYVDVKDDLFVLHVDTTQEPDNVTLENNGVPAGYEIITLDANDESNPIVVRPGQLVVFKTVENDVWCRQSDNGDYYNFYYLKDGQELLWWENRHYGMWSYYNTAYIVPRNPLSGSQDILTYGVRTSKVNSTATVVVKFQ